MIAMSVATRPYRSRSGSLSAFLFAHAFAVSGCATIEKDQVTEVEQMLAASGFEQKLADTPEKMAHLQSLPQLDITGHKDGDQPRFVYADATYCQCLYVGDQAAYKRYQVYARKNSKMDQQRQQTMWNHTNRMRWDMWGPYGGGL
jgi:hypothetical protein